jgi:hypothetical protein
VRRLRAGEWLAGTGGAALIASLALPWYGARARSETLTGFESFSVIDILLTALALLAFALVVLQATRDTPAAPLGAAVLTASLGILGVLLVLYRLIDQPGPNEFIDVRWGAWLGLASTLALAAGGWLSLANERVRGLPPGPEPELRPTPPRIAGDAQP